MRDKIASVLVNPFVFAELRSANGSDANATFEVRSMRQRWPLRALGAIPVLALDALPRASAAGDMTRGRG